MFALIREILGRQSRLPMSNISTWLVLNTALKRNFATSDEPHIAPWTFFQDFSSLQLLPDTKMFNGPWDQTPHCGSIHSRSPLLAPCALNSSDTGFYSSWDTVPTPDPRPLPRLSHLVCWNVLVPLPHPFFWLSPLILSFSAQRLLYLQIDFL